MSYASFASNISKVYLSRAQSRDWSKDNPVGDPFGGPAYGEFNDPVTATIGAVGGSIGGALIGKRATDKAAAGQERASAEAIAEQRRQFDLTRQDQTPWLQVGQENIRTIGDLLRSGALTRSFTGDDLESDPGYQFRLGEGTKSIENAARARGMFMSPATVKELLRYGQDYAGNEFQNAYNRDLTNRTTRFNMLSGAAGTGQTAANTLANAGSTMASNVGNLVTGSANARGAAGIAGANAWTGAIGNVGNLYNQYQNRNQQQQMWNQLMARRTNGGFEL